MYEILQLRSEVFVVEQNCVYQDLDGRDSEPDTVHYWIEEAGKILATVRVLRESAGVISFGRVCTASSARGRGLAGRIIDHILATHSEAIVIHAQHYLREWYATFGFVAHGDEFLEDGIPHIEMRLDRRDGRSNDVVHD